MNHAPCLTGVVCLDGVWRVHNFDVKVEASFQGDEGLRMEFLLNGCLLPSVRIFREVSGQVVADSWVVADSHLATRLDIVNRFDLGEYTGRDDPAIQEAYQNLIEQARHGDQAWTRLPTNETLAKYLKIPESEDAVSRYLDRTISDDDWWTSQAGFIYALERKQNQCVHRDLSEPLELAPTAVRRGAKVSAQRDTISERTARLGAGRHLMLPPHDP